MEYNKLVDLYKREMVVFTAEISGVQLFMLLHDKLISTVNYQGKLYKMSFTPVENYIAPLIIINDETCPDYHEGIETIYKIMKHLDKEPIHYIQIEDEIFKIEFEEE